MKKQPETKVDYFIWGSAGGGSSYQIISYSSGLSQDQLEDLVKYVALGYRYQDYPIGTQHNLHGQMPDSRHLWVRYEIIGNSERGRVYDARGCVLDTEAAFALRGDWFLLNDLLEDIQKQYSGSCPKQTQSLPAGLIERAEEKPLGSDLEASHTDQVALLLAELRDRASKRGRDRCAVWTDDPARTRALLRSTISCLPPQDRVALTFTTADLQSQINSLNLRLTVRPTKDNALPSASSDQDGWTQNWLATLVAQDLPPLYGASVFRSEHKTARTMRVVCTTDPEVHPIAVANVEGLPVEGLFTHARNQGYAVIQKWKQDSVNLGYLRRAVTTFQQNTRLEELEGLIAEIQRNTGIPDLMKFARVDLESAPMMPEPGKRPEQRALCRALKIAVAVYLAGQGENVQALLAELNHVPKTIATLLKLESNSSLLQQLLDAWFRVMAASGFRIEELGREIIEVLDEAGKSGRRDATKCCERIFMIWNAVVGNLFEDSRAPAARSLAWYRKLHQDREEILRGQLLEFALTRSLFGRLDLQERRVFRDSYLAYIDDPRPGLDLTAGIQQQLTVDPYLLWELAAEFLDRFAYGTEDNGDWTPTKRPVQWSLLSDMVDAMIRRPGGEIAQHAAIVRGLAALLQRQDPVHCSDEIMENLSSIFAMPPLADHISNESLLWLESMFICQRPGQVPVESDWKEIRKASLDLPMAPVPINFQELMKYSLISFIEDALAIAGATGGPTDG